MEQSEQVNNISNEFGTITFKLVTDHIAVKNINYQMSAVQANDFDIKTAEKIALITGNKGIQIGFAYPLNGRAYMLMHNTPSTAAICHVSVVDFVCPFTPEIMLEKFNRYSNPQASIC